MRIAVAGTGYVGLSIATLLAQHNEVTAVDIVPEKVDKINRRQSPIQDEYIEKYLAEKDLHLVATLDAESAYKDAEYVVIAAPTNYDSRLNYFDTSAGAKSESKRHHGDQIDHSCRLYRVGAQEISLRPYPFLSGVFA